MRTEPAIEHLTLAAGRGAHSPGLGDADLERARDLLDQAGAPFPGPALFAAPFDKARVAVVRASAASAHFLIAPRRTYARLGDPFRLADACPVPTAPGEWPALDAPPALPRPPVAGLLARLGESDMPLVLGATQALLDGARVRLGPGDGGAATLRLVWELLPDSARGGLWPHTGATARTEGDFHATSCAESPTPGPGVLTAEQCRDYPEGRYELALQTALEHGDQAAADALFARASSAQTLRVAAGMLAVTLIGAAVVKLAG